MEIFIIIAVVTAIVVAFEIAIIRDYKKAIKDLKQSNAEQEDYIKFLQGNNDRIMKEKFKEIRDKLSAK